MINDLLALVNSENIYLAANWGVIPFWLLLIFAPNHSLTNFFVQSIIVPLLLAVGYIYLSYNLYLENNIFDGFELYSGLDGLYSMFANESLLLIFWLHFLAISLFAGSWIIRDSLQKKSVLMIKPFDFYFDFISPYSFLAHKEIRKIEHKASIKVKYKPILLGGLHNLHGIKAPAFIPAKAKHMIRDCKLIAEKNNIKFKFNSYFPIRSLNLMRGVFVAEEDNYKSYYIDSIFNSIWQDGLNMNDENIIQKVLKNLNVNPKTFALRATSSTIKDSLKRKTSEAYEKGIFGAPTFVSNNKIFWGQDRMEFVLKEASK